jgi:hypothetical protein
MSHRRHPLPNCHLWALLLMLGWLLPGAGVAEFAPVTDPAFQVTQARPVFDRRNRVYLLDVTVTHTGSVAAPGSYRLVVASANKTAISPDGTTAANEPFYDLLTGDGAAFAAGASMQQRLSFTGGRGQLIATLRLERDAPPPPPNEPPTADAGVDQTLTLATGETTVLVTLDGSASSDPDGSIAGYAWTGAPQPDAIAVPQVLLPVGVHSFTLVVTDDQGASSAPASVMITVLPAISGNQAPVADAGPDRTLVLYPGEETLSVRLDGGGSFDPDGAVSGWRWAGTPTAADQPTPVVTLGEGLHPFTLVVVDDQGAESGPATVTINVERLGPQQPPVLTMPVSPLTVAEGETLTFVVSASDPDGDPVALRATPPIPNATFTATNGVTASGTFNFTPDLTQAGTYDLAITARDPLGLTTTETVTIQVLEQDRPPTLTVAERFDVAEGQVLAFTVAATDPDGDPVLVSATGVPPNAVFLPGSATFSFAPDFEQAGTYQVVFEGVANDLSSGPVLVEIDVNDIPTGQVGGAGTLDLQVNPPASPTLVNRARITGSVNADLSAPPVPPVVSALITGLAAASGRQGETLSVAITGGADGPYRTGFADGTRADFGPGIAVLDLRVTGPDSAIAELAIAADATPGPRPVTLRTGPEVAVSVVAFNVLPGTTTVSGQLLDPDTGQPIVGARVGIQGTGFSGVTDADGRFMIIGAPAGPQRLVVNAPNREPVRLDLTLSPNEAIEIGALETRSLVFDPSTPPSATVPSVLARGAGSTNGRIGLDEARAVVVDTWLAVGGDVAGVRDEFGNQLNPLVEGDGLVTLSAELVDATADLLARGDSNTLSEVLYALAFVSAWQQGSPPTLSSLLAGLQRAVDRAWADPRAPGSAAVQAIFNRGNRLLPTPPILTPETPLSALQRQLLVLGFFSYVQQVRDANPQLAGVAPVGEQPAPGYAEWLLDQLIPMARAADPPLITLPTDPNVLATYWADTLNAGNVATGSLKNLATGVATVIATNGIAKALGARRPGGASAGDFSNAIWGQVQPLITGVAVALILETIQPRSPLVLRAQAETASPASDAGPGWQIVTVKIARTNGDRGVANPPGLKFIYRLWRFERPGAPAELVGAGLPDNAAGAAGLPQLSMVQVDPDNAQQLILVDLFPRVGHNLYKVDVIRTVGEQTPPSSVPWYFSLVPQPSISGLGGKLALNPAGALTTLLDPLVQIATALRKMISPLSDYAAAYVGERRSGTDAADGFVIDPAGVFAFESVRSEDMIYSIALGSMSREPFVRPGFKTPFQSGLAIDAMSNLYTENAASDDRFGGKIFRLDGLTNNLSSTPGRREHVGMTNYYSHLLGYARPTAVPAMVMSLDGELFVADAIDRQIKKVPVNRTFDPWRRVGQVHATSPLFQFAPGTDLARSPDNALYITQPGTDNVLYVPPEGGAASEVFADGLGLFTRPRSVALDRSRTLYVGDAGATSAQGSIKVFPLRTQLPGVDFDDCAKDRYTLLDGIDDLSFVRIDPFGQRLFYRAGGVTRVARLGLTGQVRDADGNPVAGAEVRLERAGAGLPMTYVTNACGTFRALDLDQSGAASTGRVTISHPQIGSRVFATWFESTGQTFRDFVLTSPPSPPPPPPDDPPSSNEPVEVPPLPDPVTVLVTPGEVASAPPLEVEVVTIDNGPDPCAGGGSTGGGGADDCAPPPPEPTAERLTIVSPPDGAPLPEQLRAFIESPETTDLSGVKVHVAGADAVGYSIGARAFADGVNLASGDQPLAPGASADLTIATHELAHALQQTGQSISDGAMHVLVELKDPSGQVIDSRSIRLQPGLEHPSAPGQPAGSVVGQVVTADTGEGLVGVPVRIEETGEVRYTDPNGLYQFPLVPPGAATIGIAPGE